MKPTIEDLKKLFPTIVDEISKMECRCGEFNGEYDEFEDNEYLFDKDGLFVQVNFGCSEKYEYDDGDYWTPGGARLLSQSGQVNSIVAGYYDEETLKETIFDSKDLHELWDMIEEELNFEYA